MNGFGTDKNNIVFLEELVKEFEVLRDFQSAFWCAKGDYSVRRGNRSLLSDGTEAEGSLHTDDEKEMCAIAKVKYNEHEI